MLFFMISISRKNKASTQNGPPSEPEADAGHGTGFARGLAVVVWTVNDPEDMRELIALGVDGIITNWPNRLVEATDGIDWSLPCPHDGS